MSTRVVLLRGINVGQANRIRMPELIAAVTEAGLGSDVLTYAQSGNLILDTELEEAELAAGTGALLRDRFGINSPAVVRDGTELKETVAANPFLPEARENPKLMQVVFFAQAPEPPFLERLSARAAGAERFHLQGRHLYTWHPDGIARSKLALTAAPAGVAATARNWKTVTTLSEMTREP